MVLPHPEIYLSVDIKTKTEEDLVEVIEIFKRFKMEERIIIGSFKSYDFEKIKQKYKCQNVAFFAGVKHCAFIIYATMLGLLPFVNIECDAYCYPYYFESLSDVKELPRFKNWFLMKIWRLYLDFIFTCLVKNLQKRNVPVSFWTVNRENDVEMCIKFGVNGIVCDNPTTLLKYIDFKGLRK